MNPCERLSDRIPVVASGRDEWTPAERAHLLSCGECSAEWELVTVASALGRNVTVDTAAIIPLVLGRVRAARAEDQRRRFVARPAVLAALAVAATMLLVLLPREGEVNPGQAGPVAMSSSGDLQLAELDDAAPAELEMVLVEFDGPAMPASSLDGPDLEGLDQSQVERALRSWEES